MLAAIGAWAAFALSSGGSPGGPGQPADNSGQLESEPGAVPYECPGNTLREYFPNDGSATLTRVSG